MPHQEIRWLYGRRASSGSVVGSDPLNEVDPTGEIAVQVIGFGIGAGLEYLTNPCATALDIALAGGLGAVGGGVSKAAFLRFGPKSLTRVTGKEWSHSISKRAVDKYASGPLRRALNERGGLNGSWVSPGRHFRHDVNRYPPGWRDMGDRLEGPLYVLDRVPDWLKATTFAGGAGAAVAGADCGCP